MTGRTLDALQCRLLNAAIRAPSGDNCQPWAFRFTRPDCLLIYVLPEQAKSFFDFRQGPTFLSAGAVIENVRTQAAAEGLAVKETFLGGLGPTDPLIELVLQPPADHIVSESRLQAMLRRTVNRRPFLPWPVSERTLQVLLNDPIKGTTVRVIRRRVDIAKWAKLVYLADRIRFSHPTIHQELFSKIIFKQERKNGVQSGLESDRLGLGPSAEIVLRWLRPWERMKRLSHWGVDRVLAGQSRWLANMTGCLMLVSIPASTPENWVKAGEQVQRLWIKAQEHKLAVHPMTIALYLDLRFREEGLKGFLPVQQGLLGEMRQMMAGFGFDGVGTMLFRLGYAVPMRGVAVRRRLEEFVQATS
jgi:hypothetical protein